LRSLKEIPSEKIEVVFCGFIARLFYLEGLLDAGGKLDGFQIEKRFLRDLLELPYKELLEKYPLEKFLDFMRITAQWLGGTDRKSSVLNVFFRQVNLSKGKKGFKI